jgi:hypothetical protein
MTVEGRGGGGGGANFVILVWIEKSLLLSSFEINRRAEIPEG